MEEDQPVIYHPQPTYYPQSTPYGLLSSYGPEIPSFFSYPGPGYDIDNRVLPQALREPTAFCPDPTNNYINNTGQNPPFVMSTQEFLAQEQEALARNYRPSMPSTFPEVSIRYR